MPLYQSGIFYGRFSSPTVATTLPSEVKLVGDWRSTLELNEVFPQKSNGGNQVTLPFPRAGKVSCI
ncbi:MAG: hypothetical protein P8L78_17020 [Mariniblastus sp.]|nr:hypothetical protein [Mariniblastus sp.]